MEYIGTPRFPEGRAELENHHDDGFIIIALEDKPYVVNPRALRGVER
jgi:hypothetical protein